MRLFVVAFLGLFMLGAGGCTVTRGISFDGELKAAEAPPPGGALVSRKVEPFYKTEGVPHAQAQVHSPLGPAETLAWFRERLAKNGWTLYTQAAGSKYSGKGWQWIEGSNEGEFYALKGLGFPTLEGDMQAAGVKLTLRLEPEGEGKGVNVFLDVRGDGVLTVINDGIMNNPVMVWTPLVLVL